MTGIMLFYYETIDESMLMVTAAGTAVTAE